MPLNAGIFCLHAVLTASFVAIPLLLRDQFAVSTGRHWIVYLSVMGLSLAIMLPGLLWAERRKQGRLFLLLAAAGMVLSLLWLGFFQPAFSGAMVTMVVFFAGFNALEAMLPALASKRAPPENKGATMGVFSTCQFSGVFFGGLFGGLVLDYWGLQAIFIASSGIIAAWLLITVVFANTEWSLPAGFNTRRAGSSEH
jgi:predicted MFS family arabinose efflux permease